MSELIYGSYDGIPTVYLKGSGGFAWSFINGEWVEANGPDVFTKMPVMSKAAFNKRWPNLPPPPSDDALP